MKAIVTNRSGSRVISGPENGQPEYHPLEVARLENGSLYSGWKPSLRERVKLLFGARIWVGLLTNQQPPIHVLVGNLPDDAV